MSRSSCNEISSVITYSTSPSFNCYTLSISSSGVVPALRSLIIAELPSAMAVPRRDTPRITRSVLSLDGGGVRGLSSVVISRIVDNHFANQDDSSAVLRNLRKGSSNVRNFLPVIIDGQSTDALPDSMSCANVLSLEYVKSHGLRINDHPSKRRSFVNAIGQTFTSIGEVRLRLQLLGQTTHGPITETFSVVGKCAASLVLGQPFLEKHQIFTRFRHLLKKVSLSASRMWRLMHMDIPCQKFMCSIDGESIPASIDTGSDKNFLSLNYVRCRGWKMKRLTPNRGYVELADGTVVKAKGYINKLIELGDTQYWERFYILDGLMSDVLLGDETIDRINFYRDIETKQMSHLWVDSENLDGFHAITWLDRVEDHASNFLSNPAYQVPHRDMQAMLQGIQQQGNMSSTYPSTKRDRWWQSQSNRDKHIEQQYQLLRSGIWTKLERLDNAESEARCKANEAMNRVSGDDLRRLQEVDTARRKIHNDERARLLELRTKLSDWKKAQIK